MKKANWSLTEAPETKGPQFIKSLDQDLNLAVGTLQGSEGDGKQSRKSGAAWGEEWGIMGDLTHALSSLEN